MKHIRKYNESIISNMDINMDLNEESFKEFFQELIDLGYSEIEFLISPWNSYEKDNFYQILVKDFFKMDLSYMPEFIDTIDFCSKRIPEAYNRSIINNGLYGMKITFSKGEINNTMRPAPRMALPFR